MSSSDDVVRVSHAKWRVYGVVGGLLLLWGMSHVGGAIRYVLGGHFTFV